MRFWLLLGKAGGLFCSGSRFVLLVDGLLNQLVLFLVKGVQLVGRLLAEVKPFGLAHPPESILTRTITSSRHRKHPVLWLDDLFEWDRVLLGGVTFFVTGRGTG